VDYRKEIEIAYNNAIDFTKNHYENFPVISFLIPKHLQKHIAIVYQFARQADDIADEGEATVEERLVQLRDYESELGKLNNKSESIFWKALHNTIYEKELEVKNFSNLLTAFIQDLTKKEYANYEELLSYCSNSANPVGRIILELNGVKDADAMKYSDKICTALQITNFLQDVSVDYQKGRIYLPKDEMEKFGVTESVFYSKSSSNNFKLFMQYQVERVQSLFDDGKNLLPYLPFALRQQIRWTINGGNGILDKIIKLDFDVLNSRPKFSKIDLLKLLLKR
jgi:squalene synthase HpnC